MLLRPRCPCIEHVLKNPQYYLKVTYFKLGEENKKAIACLKMLANSLNEKEYKTHKKIVDQCINERFADYFKSYEKKKQKWVHYLMADEYLVKTNMAIESYHKTLKYSYLNGKRNKRVDTLIIQLLKLSSDFSYQKKMAEIRGEITTFSRKCSERHSMAKKEKMKFTGEHIQVFFG